MTLEELDRLNKGNKLDKKIRDLKKIANDLDKGVVYLCDVCFSSNQGGFVESGCNADYKYTLNTKEFKEGLKEFVKGYLKRKIEYYKSEFEKL